MRTTAFIAHTPPLQARFLHHSPSLISFKPPVQTGLSGRSLHAAPSRSAFTSMHMMDASSVTAANTAAMVGGWILLNMVLYARRRGRLHDLDAMEVLRRHLDPHPHFGIVFAGWVAFLALYAPVQLILEAFFDCAVYYYAYPCARGAGLLVEKKTAPCTSKVEKQLLRVDWHRFKLCVTGKAKTGRWVGHSIVVNLPHIDVPSTGVKHWPWKQNDALRLILKRLHLSEEQRLEEQVWQRTEARRMPPSSSSSLPRGGRRGRGRAGRAEQAERRVQAAARERGSAPLHRTPPHRKDRARPQSYAAPLALRLRGQRSLLSDTSSSPASSSYTASTCCTEISCSSCSSLGLSSPPSASASGGQRSREGELVLCGSVRESGRLEGGRERRSSGVGAVRAEREAEAVERWRVRSELRRAPRGGGGGDRKSVV